MSGTGSLFTTLTKSPEGPIRTTTEPTLAERAGGGHPVAGEVAAARMGPRHQALDHQPLALDLELQGRARVGAVDDDLPLRRRAAGAEGE